MNNNPNDEYRTLDDAFDALNAALFAGRLPAALITLHRHPNARGYYSHNAFTARRGTAHTSEIALNPDTFAGRSDIEILSTLAHEMAHLWQAYFGDPGRGRYHNAEWAREMKAIGLQPVAADGSGKETGQRITHEIVPGAAFDRAARAFLAGQALQWQAAAQTENAAKKRASKTRFTCPDCGQNAWAKAGAALICGACLVAMQSESDDDAPDAGDDENDD